MISLSTSMRIYFPNATSEEMHEILWHNFQLYGRYSWMRKLPRQGPKVAAWYWRVALREVNDRIQNHVRETSP
jgi:hypothetical protein